MRICCLKLSIFTVRASRRRTRSHLSDDRSLSHRLGERSDNQQHRVKPPTRPTLAGVPNALCGVRGGGVALHKMRMQQPGDTRRSGGTPQLINAGQTRTAGSNNNTRAHGDYTEPRQSPLFCCGGEARQAGGRRTRTALRYQNYTWQIACAGTAVISEYCTPPPRHPRAERSRDREIEEGPSACARVCVCARGWRDRGIDPRRISSLICALNTGWRLIPGLPDTPA